MYELNFYWGVKRHENEECTYSNGLLIGVLIWVVVEINDQTVFGQFC